MTLDELKQFMETIRDGAHIVYALIDAEIERQSVTVEDVAEAIEWLDEDRRNLERKVAQTSSFNAGILRRELNRVRLAIQALQAYRPVEVAGEDVAFAIEELEEVNNSLKLSRDGQKELGDEKEAKELGDWIFANELAIKVLKAYRPEREPCNWCGSANNTHKMLLKIYGENYDPSLNRNGMSGNEHNVGYAYIDGSTIRYSAPQGETSWDFGIIYCPMCGRYLREAKESE